MMSTLELFVVTRFCAGAILCLVCHVCLFTPVLSVCVISQGKMERILCYFVLIFYFVTSDAFSYDAFSSSSTGDFRQFAAGNFESILTDSCSISRTSHHQIGKGPERSEKKTKQHFEIVSRTTSKTEEMNSIPEHNFVTNVTNSTISSEAPYDDKATEEDYELHLLPNSSESGAVCLDGTPPGYYFHNGSGIGKFKWIIFFQGGAWCHDPDTCYQRSSTALGSSACLRRHLRLEGLLSNKVKYNPEFYNWTKVFVPYCDGASFTGNREKPLKVKNKLLYFRGRRILEALSDDLLRRGIDKASEIILSGRSAGALTAIIHTDYIRTRFRRAENASFRILADAGFFVDAPSLNGTEIIRSAFQKLYTLHNSALNQACLGAQKRKQEWRCLFPQYSVPFVNTPIFLVNSLYDLWQIAYLSNIPCVLNIKTCNSTEMSQIMKFRKKTLRALRSVFDSRKTAVFADACLVHTQCVMNALWTRIQVQNVTISQAFTDWYRGDQQERFRIDGLYPCNLTCPKHYGI